MQCQCNGPGWCDRHKLKKSEDWYKACVACPALFQEWERGTGPGQAGDFFVDRIQPLPVRLWPLWAKLLKMCRKASDKGIGDTLGGTERERLNRRYPYDR